jgi:hypothetical protein
MILGPKNERIAVRLNMHTVGTNLDAMAARAAAGQPGYPVFAHGIAIAVRRGADFPADAFLRPVVMSKALCLGLYRLNAFSLKIRNSVRHAQAYSENKCLPRISRISRNVKNTGVRYL